MMIMNLELSVREVSYRSDKRAKCRIEEQFLYSASGTFIMAYFAVELSTICLVELVSVPGTEPDRVSTISRESRTTLTRHTRRETVFKDVVKSWNKSTIIEHPKKVDGVSVETVDDCLEWCLRRLTCTVALVMHDQCWYSANESPTLESVK